MNEWTHRGLESAPETERRAVVKQRRSEIFLTREMRRTLTELIISAREPGLALIFSRNQDQFVLAQVDFNSDKKHFFVLAQVENIFLLRLQ